MRYALLLVLVTAFCGCGSNHAAQTATPTPRPIPAPIRAEFLRKMFPEMHDVHKLTFTKEEPGLVEAGLYMEEDKVATFSIADVVGDAAAREKFRGSSHQVGIHPAVEVGKLSTLMLVGDRYQVGVASESESFTPFEREIWLKRFRLSELATLDN